MGNVQWTFFFRYVLNINYHDTWDETGPTDIIKHKNASRLIAIASERLGYQLPIFNTSYYTIFLCGDLRWCLAQAQCRRYKVRYSTGFKTSTTSGRSVQFRCNGSGILSLLMLCSVR